MIKATCSSTLEYDNILKNGIKTGYKLYRETRFIRKPNIKICYNCSKHGHIAKYWKHQSICSNCGLKDHTKTECPETNDPEKINLKCPNCNDKHPATYAGCSKYQDISKKLRENERITK